MSTNYINALNVGTGLDTAKLVDAIVDARRVPRENLINDKIEAREVQISAFAGIKKTLNDFSTNATLYDGVNGAQITTTGADFSASINNSSLVNEFSHSISVDALATGQTLVFDGFSSPTDTLGSGTLTFSFGTWSGGSFTANGTSSSVTISDGNESLEAIAASINDADIDVTASVIETSTDEYSLLLRSASGADSAMAIAVTEDDSSETLDALTYTSYDSSVETVAAADAVITIDGLEVRRGSNTVTDLIDGVTLNLASVSSSAQSLTSSFDTSTALTAAQGLVAEINVILTTLTNASDHGGNGGTKGDLAGNPLVRSMINQIRSIITSELEGFGHDDVYLANYGILTTRSGTLSIDEDAFTAQYEANPDAFNAVLNSRVTTDSSMVSAKISGSSYKPGDYSFTRVGGLGFIEGDAMNLNNGVYFIDEGDADGLMVTLTGAGADTAVHIGTSFLDQMLSFAGDMVSYGNDIDDSISDYTDDISDYKDTLANFETQIAGLREQYVSKFAAMDTAVASLNNTRDSLDSFMEGWKASLKA